MAVIERREKRSFRFDTELSLAWLAAESKLQVDAGALRQDLIDIVAEFSYRLYENQMRIRECAIKIEMVRIAAAVLGGYVAIGILVVLTDAIFAAAIPGFRAMTTPPL